MKEFGWSIEYVLSLSFPVFFDLFGLIKRVRYDAAIDEFYTPYAAAKYGGKCSKNLFDGRGALTIREDGRGKPPDCTPAMVARANRKLKAIMRARQDELAKAAESK